jgi:uncharacterized protein
MAKTKLIINLTRDRPVCVGELADGPLLRMRGLLGREGLPAGEGMLITPAPGIHTAFMRFPIDALFLDRSMRIIDIVEQLRPWRMASRRQAHAVLELCAGECSRQGVEVGDRLALRERVVAGNAGDNGANGNGAGGSGAWRPGRRPAHASADAPHTTPAGDHASGVLTRLSPLRVLVSSSDRHFRTTASVLLARRNCSVTTTANSGRLSELIAREGTDVVVVDAGDPSASEAIATVRAFARPVGLVLVADEAGVGPGGQAVLARWGPFGDLVAAVEAAERALEQEAGRA